MFSDLKIIELASVLAGPAVGQFFAELGAQVIKVENPKGGDVTRSWKIENENTDDRSAYFCSINWGKESIVLDLHDRVDKNKLYELVQKADVVIASYKPGDAGRLGVDYTSISKINPQIIYGKITGFGEDVLRVGYDAIIQAESGFMSMNGEANGDPLKMPVALMDVLASHQLKEALLLAIIHRTNTGKGAEVEVNLAQTAVASLMNQATNYLVAGKIPQRIGSAHPNIAPYGEIYYSKDEVPFVLAVGSDAQFKQLCEILDTNLYEKDSFSTNGQRVKNRDALKGELNLNFEKITFEELEANFQKKHIPYGRIRNIKEALETSFAKEMLLEDQGLKAMRTNAFKLSFYQPKAISAPPHLPRKE
ncbi:MAG: CaiB/BaiF CoA transferase family protein [Candidatus Cyclobacteriaceae bacterium M2_1C_046]